MLALLPLTAISALYALTAASPVPGGEPTAGPLTTLHSFPNGTWIENFIVRQDGSILANWDYPSGRLDLVSPSGDVRNVYTFPPTAAGNQYGVRGIVELQPDVFYFGTQLSQAAPLPLGLLPVPGQGQLWRIDMREYHGQPLNPVLVANLTDSVLPNGVTAVKETGTVLVADSGKTTIFSVDAPTGAVAVASSDPILRNTTETGLGVNGIHVRNGFLYLTNLDLKLYARFPIDGKGKQTGPSETLQSGGLGFEGIDDFALLQGNAAIVADDVGGKIVYISGDGRNCSVSLADVGGPTAIRLRKEDGGKTTVYASTNGGFADYIKGGPVAVAGTISRFELSW